MGNLSQATGIRNMERIVQGTVVNSTSGTSIDFTGIPSWAKRITVMFSGVSTNGTSSKYIQIGSGTISTSGYLSSCTRCGSSSMATSNFTGGFTIWSVGSVDTISGSITICNVVGNTWGASGAMADEPSATTFTLAGRQTLSGTLDRIRITTANGTDTFDAGQINIMYEG